MSHTTPGTRTDSARSRRTPTTKPHTAHASSEKISSKFFHSPRNTARFCVCVALFRSFELTSPKRASCRTLAQLFLRLSSFSFLFVNNNNIMENHTFQDPVAVKGAPTPTWTVDVIRDSGRVLVGTLTVNNESLPPRKNKKKIAWKLPDDPSVTPKFGEHEKKRLWELFKEQKKERRRQSKKLTSIPSMESEGDQSEGFSQGETGEVAPPTATANTTPDHSVAEGTEPDDYGGTEPTAPSRVGSSWPSKPAAAVAKMNSPTTTTAKENVSPPPLPPPGFQMDKMSLQEKPADVPPPQRSSPPPPPAPPISSPPITLSNLPPPPPGLGTNPPEQPSLPPALYFSLADDQPLAALGALVVPLFLQCVTQSTVVPWLAHSHPTLSQTTLSLGSAQATGRTYIDRLQQWQSLTLSNSWDCTGCTSQTLPFPNNTVLLVLTGRTIQKQECLVYHLSLVLSASNAGIKNFQITNEILSLTTLNSVPIPT